MSPRRTLRPALPLILLLGVAAAIARDPFSASRDERLDAVKRAPPAATHEAPRSLQQVSIHALQWQGSVRRGERLLLLLRGPDGHSYGADVREPLGLERAQVLAVEADGLRLRAPGQAELRIPPYREVAP